VQANVGFNADGQPLTTTDPLGNPTTLTYDRGDLVGVTDPIGRSTRRFLDAAGRLVATTDALGNLTRQTYDALDRVSAITDPLGQSTSLEYDPNGNLNKLIDPRLKQASYAYTVMDRISSRTDPLLRTESFTYDGAGNLRTSTDRKGQVTRLSYDGRNRVTLSEFKLDESGPLPSTESTIQYTYDDGNRRVAAADSGSGTVQTLFDGLDRLTSETTSLGQVTYDYDDAGRRTSMTVAGQSAVTYIYDDADRVTEVRQGSRVVTVAYDAAGRRASLKLPNGIFQLYSYDAASQLQGITFKIVSTIRGDLVYGYDAAGRVVSVAGTYARTGLPAAISSATYDDANELKTWGGSALSYDANGNMVAEGGTTYSWNARNELTEIKQGLIPSASFVYDALGRRKQKTIGTSATQFLYDGANGVQELVAGVPSANLLLGLDIDEVFTRATITEGSANLLSDRQGSTVGLSFDGSSGTVLTSYTYDPFGGTGTAGPSNSNPFRFTGREDDGTGLYFYRARYYSPRFGRFISEDPADIASGDSNLYAYVQNQPTTFTDPTGRVPLLIFVGAGAVLGAIGYLIFAGISGHKFSWSWFAASMVTGAAVGAGAWWAIEVLGPGAAGGASLPIVASAQSKLQWVADKFHTTPKALLEDVLQRGDKYVDLANKGNVNVLLLRPDGAGYIRVTLDPSQSKVISAGLMRASQVADAIANGRFSAL
jgi:RHS repeat-associated protein